MKAGHQWLISAIPVTWEASGGQEDYSLRPLEQKVNNE
jgi:hypothetical protein